MNDIKGQLLFNTVPVPPGLRGGRLGAGHDFAVLEGDHVSSAGDVHKTLVDPGDHAIGDDGDLDFLDRAEGKASVGGVFPAMVEGEVGEGAKPWQADRHSPLAIVDLYAQAAETGGTEGRAIGSGVPVFSVRESG